MTVKLRNPHILFILLQNQTVTVDFAISYFQPWKADIRLGMVWEIRAGKGQEGKLEYSRFWQASFVDDFFLLKTYQ